MIIKLAPVRSDSMLNVFKRGDTLIINGSAFDFSKLPEGAILPGGAVASDEVIDPRSEIERGDLGLIVKLRLPWSVGASDDVLFPADIINPQDGPVELPGLEVTQQGQEAVGAIDWTQMVTAEQRAQDAADQLLALVHAETAQRRAAADAAIAPLQDAVDLDEATGAEVALLKDWKRYRVALNRLPDQAGYPVNIDWPAPPA